MHLRLVPALTGLKCKLIYLKFSLFASVIGRVAKEEEEEEEEADYRARYG